MHQCDGEADKRGRIAYNVGKCHQQLWPLVDCISYPIIFPEGGEVSYFSFLSKSLPVGHEVDDDFLRIIDRCRSAHGSELCLRAMLLFHTHKTKVASLLRGTIPAGFVAREIAIQGGISIRLFVTLWPAQSWSWTLLLPRRLHWGYRTQLPFTILFIEMYIHFSLVQFLREGFGKGSGDGPRHHRIIYIHICDLHVQGSNLTFTSKSASIWMINSIIIFDNIFDAVSTAGLRGTQRFTLDGCFSEQSTFRCWHKFYFMTIQWLFIFVRLCCWIDRHWYRCCQPLLQLDSRWIKNIHKDDQNYWRMQ